jgi:hypothetical protein
MSKGYKSIPFFNLVGLIKKVDPTIKCSISEDGHILTVETISEKVFHLFPVITNETHANAILHLEGVKVYIGEERVETEVSGLLQILKHKISIENGVAFEEKKKVFRPFSEWTDDSSIGHIIDRLTSLDPDTPNTEGIHKVITLVFHNLRPIPIMSGPADYMYS